MAVSRGTSWARLTIEGDLAVTAEEEPVTEVELPSAEAVAIPAVGIPRRRPVVRS